MIENKMLRVKIQNVLRKLRLLSLAEKVRYQSTLWSLKKSNKEFIKNNRDFKVPPTYLAFDAYSAPDWHFYKSSGEGTAKFLAEMAARYCTPGSISAVYEWGCGPARVVRHLPKTFGKAVAVYGSDYNAKTIEWCKQHLNGIKFDLNGLNPPLSYGDSTFDFIYSISVFTHLSETTGLLWSEELYRVLKPKGILLITTSGDNAYKSELLNREKDKYDNQGVVVRGEYEEGKKMYLARHSPQYVKEKLLKQFEILEHSPAGFPFIEQDYWIARKH
jgi:ubiquinone/menaquinone biosynthesis C-methylase UbiE